MYARFEGSILIHEAINAEKWIWPTFRCKVGQSYSIATELNLDVSSTYQVHISYFKLNIKI